MGFSDRLNSNRRQTMPEGIEVKDLTYTHIKEFMPKKGKSFDPIKVVGFFISKGKYGLGVSLIGEDDTGYFGINIPSWYTDRFKEATDEEVQMMLDGKLYITGCEVIRTANGDTYQLEFEDR